MIIPISEEKHGAYSREVLGRLEQAGLRAEVDASKDRMQAKIRRAQLQKVPYMLIIGDKEQVADSVAVRLRSGDDLGALSLEAFIERARADIAARV
jgi:threonyl-tRNA synthetase